MNESKDFKTKIKKIENS